jgi:hypothetical protein
MKHRILAAGILLLASLFTVKAQTGTSSAGFEQVDQQVGQFMETWNIPGASVAIS